MHFTSLLSEKKMSFFHEYINTLVAAVTVLIE